MNKEIASFANVGIVLKPGKEKSLLRRHHWVFSGAIKSFPPNCNDGDILPVFSSCGDLLGNGICNRLSQITVRMLNFDETDPKETISTRIKQAINLRNDLLNNEFSNARRLINCEGDFLPGLVVDQYNDALVLQIGSLGIEKLKDFIVKELIEVCNPSWIYEKSTSSSRKNEGLYPIEKTLYGKEQDRVEIVEGSSKFFVNPKEGQKSGFFIDQRNMRQLVREYSKGRSVLNCFSYTGGFSVAALSGGAKLCDSVDISKDGVEETTIHIEANGFKDKDHKEICQDVFLFLREDLKGRYNFIILDPPAFAKQKKDVHQAARGYKEIQRLALKQLPPNSLLLTSSCSSYIDETLFKQILFGAALDAKRDIRIIQSHHLAECHPLNIYHPEGSYLKSFFCHVV